MSRIGGPKPPAAGGRDGISQAGTEAASQTKGSEQAQSTEQKSAAKVKDSFEMANPALAGRLKSIRNLGQAAKLQFSNADLAELVKTFAGVLRQNPNADRLKRAKLFAKAALKRKRLGKLLASEADDEFEELYEAIAEQIESSPLFAQLLDEISEESLKFPTS